MSSAKGLVPGAPSGAVKPTKAANSGFAYPGSGAQKWSRSKKVHVVFLLDPFTTRKQVERDQCHQIPPPVVQSSCLTSKVIAVFLLCPWCLKLVIYFNQVKPRSSSSSVLHALGSLLPRGSAPLAVDYTTTVLNLTSFAYSWGFRIRPTRSFFIDSLFQSKTH